MTDLAEKLVKSLSSIIRRLIDDLHPNLFQLI
jgi:hypothetical protein